MIMRKRLIDQNAQPFLYQAIGDYQVEAAKTSLGRDFRIGDLAQIVLSLFGALPLSPTTAPTRNLGSIIGGGVRTLVHADSPNKLTGAATLKKALAQRDEPARRLGQGGGAGLELRTGDCRGDHRTERSGAGGAGDSARSARPVEEEGRVGEVARHGALCQFAISEDQAGAARAGSTGRVPIRSP